MKKILLTILIISMIPINAYAIGTKNTMEKLMDMLVGENINTVIDSWGYPTTEKTIAGRKLYYWNISNYSVSGNQYGVYGGEQTCNRILEVDNKNNVIKWQWEGNSCPATYFTGKQWVNPNNDPWKAKKDAI